MNRVVIDSFIKEAAAIKLAKETEEERAHRYGRTGATVAAIIVNPLPAAMGYGLGRIAHFMEHGPAHDTETKEKNANQGLTKKETTQVIKQLVAVKPKEKKAGLAVPALEAAGLGILAVPGIRTLRDQNASAHDKNHAAWETAGLGVLGAHPMYELGQHAMGNGAATHGVAAGGGLRNALSNGFSRLRNSNLVRNIL